MLLFLPFLGVAVGFVSGFFGIGGGMMIVPVMMALGYGVKAAIGISVLQMLMSSAVGSYFNYKNADFRMRDALTLGLGALAGASLSGFVVVSAPDWALKGGLALALAFCVYKMLFVNLDSGERTPPKWALFTIGFAVALVAVSMGIGGAFLLTPIMVGFLGMDIKKAVSLGLFFVIFSSFSGFVSMSAQGLVDYRAGLIMGLGSIVGVYFGTKAHHLASKATTRKWLLIFYVCMLALTLKSLIWG